MKKDFKELEVVILKHEKEDSKIIKGMIGTIVHIFIADEPIYYVEFADTNGVEIETLELIANDIELFQDRT